MAAKHLLAGVVDNVVIDSPLSSQFQFDCLVGLTSVIPNTRIVIVECKPKNLYLWWMLFERCPNESLPWYKPKIWDEIEVKIPPRHDCDEHFLSLVLLATGGENEAYSCSACADLVHYLFYTCKTCNKYYHINCLNEIPNRVAHEHGAHHHHMRLVFTNPEEAEVYVCHECLELRDPMKWFYSCEKCPYEVHLGCILQKEEIGDEGAPFTRKTEFATLITTSLKCPLLCAEDFLHMLDPNRLQISLSPNNSEPFPPPNPQFPAFMIICQMAISHLANGVADNVVIDSSLPRSQLDMLIQVATASPNIRVVVIECKPKNTYLWKMVFEKHINHFKDNSNWYKAKNWDDICDAIQDDEDESSLYGPGVSKLVLDPLTDNLYTNGIPLYIASEPSSFEPPLFMEAVRYMMTRLEEDGEGPFVVMLWTMWMYHQWRQFKDRHSFTPYMENRKLLCLVLLPSDAVQEIFLCKACGKFTRDDL
ncbi:hypothetical protein V2J09_002789 [Rumex salicifolius]